MALGIVDDSLFDSEINRMNESPIPTIGKIEELKRGRGITPDTPESIRQIIGENLIEEGRANTKELSKFLGISDSSLAAYNKGNKSNGGNPDPKLQSFLRNRRLNIARSASKLINEAITHVTDAKLADSSARELSGFMKDMSAVVKDMLPDEARNATEINNQVQFVMYSPQIAKESKFDVITINE
jgi:predicted transcriptional regulator